MRIYRLPVAHLVNGCRVTIAVIEELDFTNSNGNGTLSNTKQILAMIRSQAEGDEEQFFSIALQVAAAEARKGHRNIAVELRQAVDEARSAAPRGPSVPIPFGEPSGDLSGLLELRNPELKMRDVIAEPDLKAKLAELIRQQIKREWLREHGQVPNRKLLFVGPPGSGKTMSAEALAGELRLPLFVIRLESLITRYMGETAAKLRLVFDEINRRRGIYLFDEFDAVGGNRAAINDVAEMRRVLNSFLQLMEESSTTDSVIVAATNYPELLDRALLRRFDAIIKFVQPGEEEIKAIIRNNLQPLKCSRIAWKKITNISQGLSQSELAKAAQDTVKTAILDEVDTINTEDLVSKIKERVDMKSAFDQKESSG